MTFSADAVGTMPEDLNFPASPQRSLRAHPVLDRDRGQVHHEGQHADPDILRSRRSFPGSGASSGAAALGVGKEPSARDPELSAGRLARRLGVQELSRAVNRACGMNVSQWVNRKRIDEAAAMLCRTEKSVSEIHRLSGVLSRSNFYQEFRRIHGCNPGAFRARQD
jgi:AraC-like DNA-binding protein